MKKIITIVLSITLMGIVVIAKAQGEKAGIKEMIKSKNEKNEIKIVEVKVKKQQEERGKKIKAEPFHHLAGERELVEFLDNKGNVKKRIKEEYKIYEKKVMYGVERVTKGKRSIVVVTGNNKYVGVLEANFVRNNDDTIYRTGWEYKSNDIVTIYNEEGEIIGRKEGLYCDELAVTEDGERFMCYRYMPDSALDDIPRSPEGENGTLAEITVWSTRDGKLLFKVNGKENTGFINPNISPKGKWIVARSYGEPSEVYVFGVENNESYTIIPKEINGVNLWTYNGITDEGEIIYKPMVEISKGNWIEMKYLYNPKEKILKKLTEE